ncbi:hypothetical protein SAMN06265371_10631 [Lutibacter agarilyticus]|uniref:Uncharacterized protein n=1 Tax=Lutibacter agarilyticus TaxID=1109740 RepID=A0A238XH98_9FLAO|nr:hypothetical protein [Lutibacter agarilyticus]SNR58070.1 hypothetical protein SAMN06265371_10631 [Lutibacter agarilyticus]
MEEKYYTCQFCQNEFIPTRRKAQKFCSDTCRNKNHQHKKKKAIKKPIDHLSEALAVQQEKMKVEAMSAAGVGNAMAGTLAANAATAYAKNLFVSKENKPATKGDLDEIKRLISTRFFLIQNMDRRYDGALPYFDMATSSLIYLEDPNYINSLDNIV